jgi:asparagine synthase (glutamine-hydrolysing)
MCGICGAVGAGSGVDERRIGDMLDAIEHRGPDEKGIHLEPGVALGAQRLSIIDLPGAGQPLKNEDGSVVLVFNGEIYNFRELQEGLRRNGHSLRSNGDGEVIVHLYEELGERCVEELGGMFAFALWDRRKRRMLIARDRLGIKPLYYASAPGSLVFGSEIKALLQHPAVEARLDLAALGRFLALKYVPAPQTMFAGVSALPPGHLLVSDERGVRIERYWDVSFRSEGPGGDEGESAERLLDLLRRCVRDQLVSDVPFGAFLSGGLDSSTVVALMSEFLAAPVRTFAVGYGDVPETGELPYARMVAQRWGTEHEDVLVTAGDFIDLAERVVWHLDQPIADNACVANYVVARLAAGRVKMVLTGEGGDELFAGYARYSGERLSPLFRRLPGPARRMPFALSARFPAMRRPKIALYALSHTDDVRRFVNWFPLFNDDMRRELATGELASALDSAPPEAVFADHLRRADADDPLGRMLYVDTKLWLPDDLLARGDKMSMAASLEARVPLLDHRMVEFAAGLPSNLKLRGMARKYLLKRAARELLPDEILERPKQGFPVPLSTWFRGEARQFLRDHLSESQIKRRGLFDPGYVGGLLDEHEARRADHGALLWGLLAFELWQRLYLDRPPAVARVTA